MAHPVVLNATSIGIWALAQETLLGQTANYTSSQWLETLQSTLTAAVKRQYLQNDYFAGGVGLMLIGACVARGKLVIAQTWKFLTKRRGVVTVSVSPDDAAYVWLQKWLSKHLGKDSSQLNLQSRYEMPTADTDDDDSEGEGSRNPSAGAVRAVYNLFFVPKLQEAQKFEYNSEVVTFQLETRADVLNKGQSGDVSTLFKSLASKDALIITATTRETIEKLIKEAMAGALAAVEERKVTNVNRWSIEECYWDCIGTRPVRPLHSVVLDGGIIETLVKDARTFMGSARWYSDRGVPHRRGYLLHGPPGCGKSSSILALAGELNLDVNLVGLSSKDMTDEMLHNAFSRCDARSILVLEDIDAAFAQRDGKSPNTLSFSGLLNCIDGVCAQEGRILIMTTNHLNKLDPALTRPGRCDVHLHLGLASRAQVTTMYRRFYPDAPEDDVNAFADRVPEGTVSPAKLQGFFLLHRDDREAALADIPELTESPPGGSPGADPVGDHPPVEDAPGSPAASGAEKEDESETDSDGESDPGSTNQSECESLEKGEKEEGFCTQVGTKKMDMAEKVVLLSEIDIGTENRRSKGKRLAKVFSCMGA